MATTLKHLAQPRGGDVIEFEADGRWMGWLMLGHRYPDIALIEMLFGDTKSKQLENGGEIDRFLRTHGAEGLATIRESFQHVWAVEVPTEDEDAEEDADIGPSFEFVRKRQPKAHAVTMLSWSSGPSFPLSDPLPY